MTLTELQRKSLTSQATEIFSPCPCSIPLAGHAPHCSVTLITDRSKLRTLRNPIRDGCGLTCIFSLVSTHFCEKRTNVSKYENCIFFKLFLRQIPQCQDQLLTHLAPMRTQDRINTASLFCTFQFPKGKNDTKQQCAVWCFETTLVPVCNVQKGPTFYLLLHISTCSSQHQEHR